eukprot:CAMPEP_0117656208 /NCGR_PEP_ID=MMETSP0804-20121206/4684_1 /TAXON_ID=1074897 /ORGANISM="Tetraselmis astigmatica, Strain CCMP880" /LENGTH=75 /DNA_ID=CAMNT_0005462599 /DNA_START=161 /DNA_END=388 /DNA_ORIENTATION=-
MPWLLAAAASRWVEGLAEPRFQGLPAAAGELAPVAPLAVALGYHGIVSGRERRHVTLGFWEGAFLEVGMLEGSTS